MAAKRKAAKRKGDPAMSKLGREQAWLKKLNKLLEPHGIVVFRLYVAEADDAATLYTSSSSITFDNLMAISGVLGSREINVNAETMQDEYYPSDNPESEVSVWVGHPNWKVLDSE